MSDYQTRASSFRLRPLADGASWAEADRHNHPMGVLAIWRYPVKAMLGEAASSRDVAEARRRGVAATIGRIHDG